MLSKLLLLALTLCLTAMATAQPARDFLPAGTLLQCTMDEPNFSSRTAQVGDPVLCHLSSGTASFGHPVFPRGAYLSGHLQDYKDPGHFFGKGWIEIDFDRLVLPGEDILPLSAKLISVPHYKVNKEGEIRGRGHPVRDTVEWLIPPLWPMKVIMLPARGPYPTLKGETRMTLRLMEDVEVPRSVASVPMPPWAMHSSLKDSSSPQPWRGDVEVRPADYRTIQPASSEEQPQVIRSAAYYAERSAERTAEPERSTEPQPTLLVLRDSSAYLAQDYWIEADHVRCVTRDSGDKQIPLAALDLDQTVRLNRERNVDFALRTRDTTER